MRVKLRNNKYNINIVRLREKEKNYYWSSWEQMALFLIKLEVIKLISFESQWAKGFCVQGLF